MDIGEGKGVGEGKVVGQVHVKKVQVWEETGVGQVQMWVQVQM